MHELPVTESLLELSLEHAAQAGGGRITALYLVVGPLSGIVGESVRFYWEMLSRETIAEGAVLHFRHTELVLECRGCGSTFKPAAEDYICPFCESVETRVVGGQEFHLEALDLDTAGSAPGT